jgi:hypothetical protein
MKKKRFKFIIIIVWMIWFKRMNFTRVLLLYNRELPIYILICLHIYEIPQFLQSSWNLISVSLSRIRWMPNVCVCENCVKKEDKRAIQIRYAFIILSFSKCFKLLIIIVEWFYFFLCSWWLRAKEGFLLSYIEEGFFRFHSMPKCGRHAEAFLMTSPVNNMNEMPHFPPTHKNCEFHSSFFLFNNFTLLVIHFHSFFSNKI